MIVLKHLIIQFSLYNLSSGRLWEVNKRIFQIFSCKSGRSRLTRSARSLAKGSKYNDLTCKLLVFYKTVCRGEVIATEDSTVHVSRRDKRRAASGERRAASGERHFSRESKNLR